MYARVRVKVLSAVDTAKTIPVFCVLIHSRKFACLHATYFRARFKNSMQNYMSSFQFSQNSMLPHVEFQFTCFTAAVIALAFTGEDIFLKFCFSTYPALYYQCRGGMYYLIVQGEPPMKVWSSLSGLRVSKELVIFKSYSQSIKYKTATSARRVPNLLALRVQVAKAPILNARWGNHKSGHHHSPSRHPG